MAEEKYGIFSPTHGIKQDYPSIMLKEGYLPDELGDTKDVLFHQGHIKAARKRQASWTAQMPHTINHHKQYKMRDGTIHDIVGTKRDLAYYDTSNDVFKFLTPQYSTGVVMVTNGSTKIQGGLLIDDCDNDPVIWADASGGDVTPSKETTIVKENSVSVKLAVVTGAGVEDLAYVDKAVDLSAYDSIGFWFYSSIALSAADLKFELNDNTALGGTAQELISFPIIPATTWTWVNIAMSDPSNCSAIKSLGIIQAVDKGAMDIYIDFIVAGDWAGNLAANDYITLGTDYDTEDTWYLISSVTDTEITISAVYAGSTAYQQAYLARLTFAGVDVDNWRSIIFNDKWIGILNGKIVPYYWDGNTSNQLVLLSADAPKAKYIAEFENYIILSYIITGGSANLPQKYQWCALGAETNWASGDSGSATITGTSEAMIGFSPGTIDGYKIIATTGGIYRLHTVAGDEVLHREEVTLDIGINAPDSMITHDNFLYAWCSDNTFRKINLSSWAVISNPIGDITHEINAVYKQYIQGVYNAEYQLLMWLIPNKLSTGSLNQIMTYDLNDNFAWGTVQVTAPCFGTHYAQSSDTWDGLSFATWAVFDWLEWDYRGVLANFLITLVPDYSGYMFHLFQAELDNGANYRRSFVLGSDLQQQRGIGQVKRLLKAKALFKAKPSGIHTIAMQVKRDDELSWQNAQSTTEQSIVDASIGMIFINFYFGDYIARYFKFKFGSEQAYDFIGVILYFDPDYGDWE